MKYKLHDDFIDKKNFLLNIQNIFNDNKNTIHKARNEIKVVNNIVIKSFKIPHIINRFAYTYIRSSKAKKSFLNALKISKFTPRPIGYIEFFSFGLLEKSFFISQNYDYDFTIREPLENKNFNDRESILKALAKFTYELHHHGIYHKDYSPGNILIKKISNRYEFKIVDINRMKFIKFNKKDRLLNFIKLFADDKDLKTIIYAYSSLAKLNQEKAYQEILIPNRKHREILLKKWGKKENEHTT